MRLKKVNTGCLLPQMWQQEGCTYKVLLISSTMAYLLNRKVTFTELEEQVVWMSTVLQSLWLSPAKWKGLKHLKPSLAMKSHVRAATLIKGRKLCLRTEIAREDLNQAAVMGRKHWYSSWPAETTVF